MVDIKKSIEDIADKTDIDEKVSDIFGDAKTKFDAADKVIDQKVDEYTAAAKDGLGNAVDAMKGGVATAASAVQNAASAAAGAVSAEKDKILGDDGKFEVSDLGNIFKGGQKDDQKDDQK